MSCAESPEFWENLYQNNRMPWDLGGPTPVFQRLATSSWMTSGKLLVLGAGKGHDARMFAQHGFDVTAVDFANDAIAYMEAHQSTQAPIQIVQSDFFWLPPEWNLQFDYVIDYTCFCAILPEKRSDYADLTARLLKPDGKFITLAYPIGTRDGGPPFTVQPNAMIALWEKRGFTLQHREMPEDSVPERKGYEALLILQKQPT